jgi:hypothetical protein
VDAEAREKVGRRQEKDLKNPNRKTGSRQG